MVTLPTSSLKKSHSRYYSFKRLSLEQVYYLEEIQ
jgi:hypothetical protein